LHFIPFLKNILPSTPTIYHNKKFQSKEIIHLLMFLTITSEKYNLSFAKHDAFKMISC